MFVPITNAPRPYPWGSKTAISGLLGVEASGGPEAELWLGAHPGSPARILRPEMVGGASHLDEWIARDPKAALGKHAQLPFLMKLLAAESPLSLQAHPTQEQARVGFARENDAGIALEAPERNYRDPHPKPEIIYALSERFEALCGFRPVEQTRALFQDLGLHELVPRLESLPAFVEELLSGAAAGEKLVDRVLALTKTTEIRPKQGESGTKPAENEPNSVVLAAQETVRVLSNAYPRDPAIAVALLLNRVTLARGEALFLPAGNIHAYLSGVGVEVMAASDNVLRGGFTTKHVDVAELLKVLDFTPTPVPYLHPKPGSQREIFRPDVAEFELVRVTGSANHALAGPGIAICVAGHFALNGEKSSVNVEQGQSVYITPDEIALTFVGDGELFLATTG